MNNKVIIIFLVIFFIASFFYLAYIEQNRRGEENFWALYFSDPKSGGLDFAIENYGNEMNFHWEILADKEKIKEGNIKIAKNSTWESGFQVDNYGDKKISVVVLDGESKKEVYKNF